MKHVLVTTLHDRDGRLQDMLQAFLPKLTALYREAYIAITPETSNATASLVAQLATKTCRAGTERVDAYKKALEFGIRTEADYLHYCDLDRALHWIKYYPKELAEIKQKLVRRDLVILGRTQRAFLSHPETQVFTEDVVNRVASPLLNLPYADVCAGSWGFSQRAAKFILAHTRENEGLYGEWPILAAGVGKTTYLETEGLEWETPDRFEPQLQKMGRAAFLAQFQSPAEWDKRTKMMHEMVKGLFSAREIIMHTSR